MFGAGINNRKEKYTEIVKNKFRDNIMNLSTKEMEETRNKKMKTDSKVVQFKWEVKLVEQNKKIQSPIFNLNNPLIDIGFILFVELNNENRVNVTVTKGCFKLARAVIKISINETEMSRTVDWKASHCFYNFPTLDLIPLDVNLTIGCQIIWYGFIEKLTKISMKNLNNNLISYYLQDEFSDVTLVVENHEIPAHKIILVSQSPVFLAMFHSNMKESIENKITINDISVDIIKEVLKFLYTGIVLEDFNIDSALELLKVADKYEISELKQHCEKLLTANLSIENVCKVIDVADMFNASELKKSAMNYMINNKDKIIPREDCKQLFENNSKISHKFCSTIAGSIQNNFNDSNTNIFGAHTFKFNPSAPIISSNFNNSQNGIVFRS